MPLMTHVWPGRSALAEAAESLRPAMHPEGVKVLWPLA
jgi:hypothetical protein